MVVLELWIISKVLTFIALLLVHTCGDYGHVGVVHPKVGLDLHCQYPKIITLLLSFASIDHYSPYK
jgi:hypothetical protein